MRFCHDINATSRVRVQAIGAWSLLPVPISTHLHRVQCALLYIMLSILPSPHEPVASQIAFETTSWHWVEIGRIRIHVTRGDCGLPANLAKALAEAWARAWAAALAPLEARGQHR